MMKSTLSKMLVCTIAAVMTALLLGPAQVYAVVKNFQVVQNGAPVANTKVTLISPSGSRYERTTDSDGKVSGFDFDEDGDWRVEWAGGAMLINAGGGGINPWFVGGTVVAATVASIAAADGNNSDNGGGGGGPPSSNPINGTYDMSTTPNSNPDGHPDNFQNCTYDVVESGGSIQIQCSGTGISVNMTGTLTGNNFGANGIGTYQGFSGTEFEIQGTFDPNAGTWSGTIAAGTNGSLPDSNMDMSNDPIVVNFTGSQTQV